MKSKNQDDRLADKHEEKQIGRPTGRTDIQINLYRQINRYTRQDSRGRLDRSGNARNHSQFKNVMDGPTDQRTNQPTRQGVVTCPRLKMAYRKKNKKQKKSR